MLSVTMQKQGDGSMVDILEVLRIRGEAKKGPLFCLAAIWNFGRPSRKSLAFGMWDIADCALACEQGFAYAPKQNGELVYWMRQGKVLRGIATLIDGGANQRKPARVRCKSVSYRPHVLAYCDAQGRRANANNSLS